MFIGHTRKATIGGITKAAAHPFSYEGAAGTVHGVHNGTLQRWTDLPVGSEVSDSATCYKNIAEHGLRDTVERLGGAYALIYYDQTSNTLNITRNKERTLYYAMSDNFDRIVWASEAWMLHAACNRHGFKMADLDPKSASPINIAALEIDTWFRVKIAGTGTKDVITFLPEEALLCDVIKPEVKKYVHPFHRTGPYSDHNRVPFDYEKKAEEKLALPAPQDTTPAAVASATTASSTQTSSQATTQASKDSQSPRPTLTLVAGSSGSGSKHSTGSKPKTEMTIVEQLQDLDDELPASLRVILDANGLPMSKEAFERVTDSSCCFCGANVDYDDALEHNGGAVHIPGIGLWADANRFVCTTCVPAATR